MHKMEMSDSGMTIISCASSSFEELDQLALKIDGV